jgi:hypothetical protein
MTGLVVRRPPFSIDASVPFQWQPANPSFGLFGNTFTFLAVAFERYIVAATREAMPRITDPTVAEEGMRSFARRPSTREPTVCTPTP